jgi:hypothetical protein
VVAAQQHEQPASPRESLRSFPRRRVAKHHDRSIGCPSSLIAESCHPVALAELRPETTQRDRVVVLAQNGDRSAQVRHGATPAVTGIPCAERRITQQIPSLRCLGGQVRAHLWAQLGSAFKVLPGLCEGEEVTSPLPGEYQRRERQIDIVRGQRVIGQFGMDAGASSRSQAGIGLESIDERTMEPRTLARQQLIVRGLLKQCMPELVAVAVSVGHQRLAVDSGTKPNLEVVLGELRNNLQQPVVDPPPGRSRYPQHLLRRLR